MSEKMDQLKQKEKQLTQQVQNMQNQAAQLQRQQSTVRAQIFACQNRINQLNRRRNDLENLLRQTKSTCEHGSGQVNSRLNQVADGMESMIQMDNVFQARAAEMRGKKERDHTADADMSLYVSFLDSELRSVNNQIDQANSELRYSNQQAQQIQSNLTKTRLGLVSSQTKLAATRIGIQEEAATTVTPLGK